MTEYIEREAAIAKCREIVACEWNHRTSPESWADAYEQFAEDIEEIQTADVAPVRHGEWIVCGDGDNVPWMCSHCGKTTAHKYKVAYGKYCPNCGAKMDLEG